MRRLPTTLKWLLVLAGALAIVPLGCREQLAPPPVQYSLPELEYRLIANFGDVFWYALVLLYECGCYQICQTIGVQK